MSIDLLIYTWLPAIPIFLGILCYISFLIIRNSKKNKEAAELKNKIQTLIKESSAALKKQSNIDYHNSLVQKQRTVILTDSSKEGLLIQFDRLCTSSPSDISHELGNTMPVLGERHILNKQYSKTDNEYSMLIDYTEFVLAPGVSTEDYENKKLLQKQAVAEYRQYDEQIHNLASQLDKLQ